MSCNVVFRISIVCLMVMVWGMTPLMADDDPARVLVLFNIDYPDENNNQIGDSHELALYYQQKRGIPEENMLGFYCKTGLYYSTGEWSDFYDDIVTPVKNRLSVLGEENILFMTVCYGVPLTISVGGTHSSRSLDNALMNLNNIGTRTTPTFSTYWNNNPYLESSPSILPDNGNFDHSYTYLGNHIYPVSRLEGDSVEFAKELVDRALYGELYIDPVAATYTGIGYIDTRYGEYTDSELIAGYPFGYGNYGNGDKSMAFGKFFVDDSDFLLKWEPNSQEIGEAGALYTDGSNGEIAPDAMWYGGWYNYNNYHDVFDWMVGSVACDLNSNSGASIRSPESASSFLTNAFYRGLTAGPGVTGEPYLSGHPRPEVLLYYMLNGYNFAEASFASNPALSWRVIFFGDPIYNPMKPKTPQVDIVDPPLPEVWDFATGGAGDTSRTIGIRIDTDGREPDLVVTQIDWGETAAYGNTLPYSDIFRMTSEFELAGLMPDTTYHYMVTIKDPAGNEISSIDYSFHTQINGTTTPTFTPTSIPTWTPSPAPTATPTLTPLPTETPIPTGTEPPLPTETPPPIPATGPTGLGLLLLMLTGLMAFTGKFFHQK